MELEKGESRLAVRKEDFLTIHEAQTKVESELQQLRTKTANKTSKSVEVH